MKELGYLKWMAENTPSQWCNDSGLLPLVRRALGNGAIGCTTNPPLSFQALDTAPEDYREALAAVPRSLEGDARSEALTAAVVKTVAGLWRQVWEDSKGAYGYVRAQVQPMLCRDAAAMVEMGKRYASIAPNVMVKIPGSTAGVLALEELAALGIPTTPTICISVAQMVAVAEANERGIARAKKAGIAPAESTAAIVFGRTQDYLVVLNEERGAGLSDMDMEIAATAVAKRCHAVFQERGYAQIVMPAAFRTARQVAALVGGRVHMTIRPSYQDDLDEAERAGLVERRKAIDDIDDPEVLARVARLIPEFTEAYAIPGTDPGALPVEAFDEYRGLHMTIDAFNETGWQKLKTVEIPSGGIE